MKSKIEIKTGSRISNILQSTVNYAQAFTELVKNSMQSGATSVEIKLNADSVVVIDDGIGFDHEVDENGMTGFDKYFVFGNSYDMSNGSGPTLGHMGIGGKIANDKLSDSENTLWTIETKNKKGKSFLVTYQPGKTEFLDDYAPTMVELTETNVTTNHGTIVTISNLDKPILKKGWNETQIKKELKDFFGHLVKNNKTNFNIILNGESLEFDYTLPGYSFPEMNKEFTFEHESEVKKGNIKFNLSMIQTESDEESCPLDSVIVVSDVKICSLNLDDEALVSKIYDEISKELGKEVFSQKSVRNLFVKLRGFVVCSELSEILDHTGMPAKDLSHHSLRDDHPVTGPFYEVVYRTIIDLLRGYLMLDDQQNNHRLSELADNVIDLITNEIKIDETLLSNVNNEGKKISAESKMKGNNIEDDLVNKLIDAEVYNKTKDTRNLRERKNKQEKIRKSLKDTNKNDNSKNDNKNKQNKSLKYEIKPFGADKEKIIASHGVELGFCVYINSENYKFVALDTEENNFGLALHIGESIIREITKYANPQTSHQEIDERVSEFYKLSYTKLRKNNLLM